MMRNRIKTAAATIAAAAMLLAGTPAANASAAWTSPFGDVTLDTPHATDINWAGNWGIAQGYEGNNFGGMRTVVRQDMAAFLYRLAGSPDFDQAAAERANTLTDVKPGSSHYKEVLWLTSTGIAKGYPDHTFGGMRTVVRQDMAAFLHRYADNVAHAAQPAGQAKAFTDATPGTTHYDDIAWLSKTGITQGYPDGSFGGMRDVVRQDMAAFLHRTITNLKTPVDLNGLKAKNVVTNNYAVYAIDQNDGLWAWGYNDYGQIGDGTTTNRLTPVKVPGLPKITNIVTTSNTAYATGEDGTLWAWGYNNYGQIGDGTTTNRLTPVKVPGLPKITNVIDGYGTVYATGEDGSLWAWGYNGSGLIGDGTKNNRTTPYKVPGLPKITTITTNGGTAWATGEDGSLWAWGRNDSGQIGDGTSSYDKLQSTPVKVPGLPKITNATIQGGTAYATGEDGSLWTWGANGSGQVGDGTTNGRLTPYKVQNLPKIANVTTSYSGTVYATGSDGSLWTWGPNWNGQIGDGTTTNRTTPYKVQNLPKIANVTAISSSVYATGEDGSLWTWGANNSGQIGDGTTTNRTTPYKVPGLPGIINITLAGPTTMDITVYVTGSDGSLWAWGANWKGQTGDGTTTNRTTPYKVPGLPKTTKVTTANRTNGVTSFAAYATGEDGTIWAWGDR